MEMDPGWLCCVAGWASFNQVFHYRPCGIFWLKERSKIRHGLPLSYPSALSTTVSGAGPEHFSVLGAVCGNTTVSVAVTQTGNKSMHFSVE